MIAQQLPLQLSAATERAPSQTERLYALLKLGPARTDHIVAAIYHPGAALARVGARIWDIKKRYGCAVYGWKDENPALYWYSLTERPQDAGEGGR